MKTDIVVGLSFGDEAKGKVTYNLLKNNYDYCIRAGGAANCGHTIYHNGKKFVTHAIPAGIFFNIKSIIGPACVVHPRSFLNELESLDKQGINGYDLVKIASNAHIITDANIEEDSKDTTIGTTKKGVGQAYRDRYGRVGIQAWQIPELKDYIIDIYDELHIRNQNPTILIEGSQGFFLDPYWGKYPYVTSSHTTVAGALLNGIPYSSIRNVYGCSKAYDTYVGLMKFQPEDNQELKDIQKIGNEFGATTNRVRQCNYLNINNLEKAVRINDINNLIISKVDILQKLNIWKVIHNNEIVDLGSEENFKLFIKNRSTLYKEDFSISFSYSAEII